MKRQSWLLLLLLLLALALSGCGLVGGAEKESLKRLDASTWPTPVPTTVVASPTPFPQANLAPTTSAQPPIGTPTAALTQPTAATTKEPSAGQSAAGNASVTNSQAQVTPGQGQIIPETATPSAQPELPAVISGNIAPPVIEAGNKSEAISGSMPAAPRQEQSDEIALSPVTTAKISVSKTEIRPGPNASFAPIDELTDPQEGLTVLGLDKSRQWALVQPQYSRLGWAEVADLQCDGSLDAAPTVYTAWVISNAIEVRSGPGIFYDQTGQLAINSLVRVLGLDDSGSWAMIQPIPGGSLGWSSIQFLKNVGQAWANIPPAPDLPTPVQAAATAEPFTPARPLSESKIVFQRSSGGDIMVINPDGSGLRRLTSGIDPALSPDGQWVAFTRWNNDQNGALGSLWIINVDGSGERAILGDVHQPKSPTWSSDGTRIVINMQQGGWVKPKHDCVDDPSQIPPGAYDIEFVFEPTGELDKVCFMLPANPAWGLRLVHVATGTFEDLARDIHSFSPTWDPRNNWRVVYQGDYGLVQLDMGKNTTSAFTKDVDDHTPVFSPDGSRVAVTYKQHDHWDIHVMNADGSGRVRLTQTPLWVTSQSDEAKAWNNVAPAWSPDASQIAFLTDRTGRWEIWVMGADGSTPQPMFSDEINTQLQLTYNFVDERMLSWR